MTTIEPLPGGHRRVIVDGLPAFDRFGLLLAGGYSMRAHDLLCRPSQDLDFATNDQRPLREIADAVAEHYLALGYSVDVIEARARSARLMLTLPDDAQELELDLLKKPWGLDGLP
ncbi:nucleotidyl transferase AbiEii/AbiGii toxin family protein [Actinomadura rupiterrae]|uniref:nucleotidyl transferase AbiEii/AbiGii toxin family protein n=1 Tax=Actinomadura rupiterrae TaxID=559627 RepID=UPI0020A2F737|nr:nucleotidyl transferase AbiEii/AbiGii toxin family protein [Actinomadura rupiterrae]MCP2339765.1 hypothetical protein [Actinomadura rupiterrae]